MGFEPITFSLWGRRATNYTSSLKKNNGAWKPSTFTIILNFTVKKISEQLMWRSCISNFFCFSCQQNFRLQQHTHRTICLITTNALIADKRGKCNQYGLYIIHVLWAVCWIQTSDFLLGKQMFYHWTNTAKKWSGWPDSNWRHLGPKPSTLPTELHPD